MKNWMKIGLASAVVAGAVVAAIYLLPRPDEVRQSTITLRLSSFALNLHPLKMADVESRAVATLLYTGLIAQDQDGNTTPLLAESWTRSGSEWDFVLRTGMAFSNGAPVTVADVVASLCAAMQPASPWAWSLASIAHEVGEDGKVRCTGLSVENGRVRIKESRPVPWLLDALTGPAGWIMPASNPDPGAFGVMPGTGPFTVRDIAPDVKAVLGARPSGSPAQAGATSVVFDFLPDDTVAASQFASGKLDVLDLTSPQLIKALMDEERTKLKYPGRLIQKEWDRIRVLIVNEKSLAAKGFASEQVREFIDTYSRSIDRHRIAKLSLGIGEPLLIPFLPVVGTPTNTASSMPAIDLPVARLMIQTEPDAFSDLIAASLPKRLGNVSIDYRGVEKGLLINALVKGEFDIIALPIEATVHSPLFWKSFFTEGSPLVIFGKAIPGLERIDVATDAGKLEAARLIGAKGNWIAIMRERHVQAIAPNIEGVTFTPSGQTNFIFIRRQ